MADADGAMLLTILDTAAGTLKVNLPPTHLGARLSNSSKKRMHGAAAAARANVSLTFASLEPIYFDRSSGPCK